MKKHSITVEIALFSVIFLLFILPAFFISSQNNPSVFSRWNFPLQQIILALFAFTVYSLYFQKEKSCWLKVFPVLFTFCLLFFIALIMKFISKIMRVEDNSSFVVQVPDSFKTWIFCLVNFFCAAFYEEILYRFYFVDKLSDLLGLVFKWKGLFVLVEIAGALVFAFAHIYMGFLSVINAFFAHCVLRASYRITGNIWPCVIAHFSYNVISLILL